MNPENVANLKRGLTKFDQYRNEGKVRELYEHCKKLEKDLDKINSVFRIIMDIEEMVDTFKEANMINESNKVFIFSSKVLL